MVCIVPGNLTMAPGVRVSQLMNISFDMAAWEILGSMANGASEASLPRSGGRS